MMCVYFFVYFRLQMLHHYQVTKNNIVSQFMYTYTACQPAVGGVRRRDGNRALGPNIPASHADSSLSVVHPLVIARSLVSSRQRRSVYSCARAARSASSLT